MVTLKNDDQGFARSNLTGTIFFINQKLNLASLCLFVCFDSLRPTNNLSVIKRQVFLGEAVLQARIESCVIIP